MRYEALTPHMILVFSASVMNSDNELLSIHALFTELNHCMADRV